MSKVTIIMPSFNVCEYIEEALNSAREQTLDDIEIICVDAGSTDGTWKSVQKAANEDVRIIAIQSPIKSYGYQVNMGIDQATSEYIAILETDDFVDLNIYEKLYKTAIADDLDFVKCDYSTYTTKDGTRCFIERKVSADRFFYDNTFIPAENPQVVVDDWYLWNGIYKTRFIRDNGIRFSETPGAAFQDIGFLHKVAINAHKGRFIEGSLYKYCVDRPGASSNSKKVLAFIRREYGVLLDSASEHTDKIEKDMLYRRMARSFVSACIDSSNEVLVDKDSSDICKWFQRCLSDAERWGCISEENLPVALRDGYRHLMDPAVGYISYRRIKEFDLREFLGKDRTIIIFGCGKYGREALGFLQKKGYQVTGFMDNSENLWGKNIENIRVFSPEEVKSFPEDTRYVVANEKYADEITQQLKTYDNNILTYKYVPERND